MSNINFTYTNLTPFKWYVLENFPFIEADFDALTDWQLFCKLGKEINKIIPAVNKVGQQTEDLTNFVTNYFDNLDVQDEINNKLNQMVQDGTLQEIITQYLQINGLLTFNTVSDMLNSTNLINGSTATTNGYYTFNDGGSARYKIRNITNEDVINNLTLLKLNNSETLVAELIKTKTINVKQYGAKGDGVTDDTPAFKLAMNNENTSVLVQNGNYLITDTIKLPKNIEIIGKNATLINKNNKTIFYVNMKNKISGLNLELENYSSHVFEISFKTLNKLLEDFENNLNIIINNISFNFNNSPSTNTGICFLIEADSSITENIYQYPGFWGIFISNIFIEGYFLCAIKQYQNDLQENWINSCFYSNFNITKVGIYGFLGTKDENNLNNSNYSDGDFISFDNWQMQASMSRTKNMFFFTNLGKILNTIKPWDWNVYAMENQLPINILYRSTINRQQIYIQGLLENVFHNVQITNSPYEIDSANYQRYILSVIGHYFDYGEAFNTYYYKNKILKLTLTQQQTISATTRTTINFNNTKFNTAGLALSPSNGKVTINENINHLRINCNIGLSNSPASCNIYVIKNGNIIENQLYVANQSCIQINSIIDVQKDDTIEIALYSPIETQIIVPSSPNNEFSIEIID